MVKIGNGSHALTQIVSNGSGLVFEVLQPALRHCVLPTPCSQFLLYERFDLRKVVEKGALVSLRHHEELIIEGIRFDHHYAKWLLREGKVQ